jgi:hypothetical protein
MAAILLEHAMYEDNRTWAELEVQYLFLEIEGHSGHYLATGECLCLQNPVIVTVKPCPESEVTLQSTVAPMLAVETHTESNVEVWLNLLVAANAFPVPSFPCPGTTIVYLHAVPT